MRSEEEGMRSEGIWEDETEKHVDSGGKNSNITKGRRNVQSSRCTERQEDP
jgi:hypothetical protein